MKKLIFIISLIFAVAATQAQIFSYKLGGANNFSYSGTAADTSGTADISVYKVISLQAAIAPVYFSVNFDIDDVSGNVAGHTFTIQGSPNGVTYTDIYVYTMSDADAIINYTTQDTVAFPYQYLRFVLNSDATGVTKINSISGKIVQKP